LQNLNKNTSDENNIIKNYTEKPILDQNIKPKKIPRALSVDNR